MISKLKYLSGEINALLALLTGHGHNKLLCRAPPAFSLASFEKLESLFVVLIQHIKHPTYIVY